MEAAAWGFLGIIVGAFASVATTFVAARNGAALQRSAASLDRAEKQRSFQRDTLLELQDAIHDLMRLISRVFLEERDAFWASGTWGKTLLSDEVNEGQRLAHRRVVILIERVSDDALRADVKQFHEKLWQVSSASSDINAEVMLSDTHTQAMLVLEHIGKTVRAVC